MTYPLHFLVLTLDDVIGFDAIDNHGESLVFGALMHHCVDLLHETIHTVDLK